MITRVNPDSRMDTGKAYPMGAHYRDGGINFAVYSPHAHNLILCLYDEQDQETERLNLPARSGDIWHGFLPGAEPGTRYGFRAEGDFEPDRGLVFNPNKLLVDPYAKALSKAFEPHPNLFAHDTADLSALKPSDTDSADHVPKALVPGPDAFDWQGTQRPDTAWPQTVIYEVHVKGFSQLNPAVPEELRGTYLSLAHDASIGHLTDLGITAVQLMPCLAFMSEPRLADLNLVNYWGYNPANFFAPDPRYALDDAVTEFKTMVRALHQAGIEVILDVVYNHTAEGDLLGPMLSHKGLHAAQFYRHQPDSFSHFIDTTGCGNTVDMHQLYPLTLIMDSLRHWLNEYQVDGFRFDLAATLGREAWDFTPLSAFFKAISQDPVIRHCKLIAEPWDIGRGGYQLGQFPEQWYECNDRYRDTLRRFWRGDGGTLPEFATRVMGSRDLLKKGLRSYSTSLNYVTYHDGFTLEDLVSYNQRHNAANQERNMDGHDNNLSYNWGCEGATEDDHIQTLRQQTKRNLIASLLLSQGAVHLLGGDEIGRTQQGNNNAYCQDNEINWYDWSDPDERFQAFVEQCIRIRGSSTLFHDLIFSAKQLINEPATTDKVHWYRCDGYAMEIKDWQDPDNHCLGILLSSDIDNPAINLHLCSEYYFILVNAGQKDIVFTLPANPVTGWQRVFDTALNDGLSEGTPARIRTSYTLKAHSLALLARCGGD